MIGGAIPRFLKPATAVVDLASGSDLTAWTVYRGGEVIGSGILPLDARFARLAVQPGATHEIIGVEYLTEEDGERQPG